MAGNAQSRRGGRCLIVEDEFLIAMLIEDTLSDLGFEVAGTASSCAAALAAIESLDGALDGAVLDVNLAGERVYPVAEALQRRGVPFVFITGYAAPEVENRFADIPVVQKPWAPETLAGVLAATFRPAKPPGDSPVNGSIQL